MTRIAICIGLTRVDPAAYDGWSGDCPGCDRDAARVATLCHDAGFDGVTVLINAAANSSAIREVFRQAAADMAPGGLLVLYNSGHGGQQRDTDGDEDDGADETLCWWDGEVRDDTIARHLQMLPAGTRVLYATDTCNSGSNFRGRGRVKHSTPVKIKSQPRFAGSLLHFGGCADGRSSYGADEGGEFTLALLKSLKQSRKPLTYRQWFDRAAKKMPKWQVPVWSEWGEPSFLDREALT